MTGPTTNTDIELLPTTAASDPTCTAHLYGVGVGPGDPELMTLKAKRIIEQSAVIAHFAARGRIGNAWGTVAPLIAATHTVLRLEYPVTTEAIPSERYEDLIAAFYDASAAAIAVELERGRDVAVVCEGDPFFYGSYMYVHQRLAARFPTTVVPGVTSFSAASAAAGVPLVSMNETLTVLSGVLAPDELKQALADADAAVVMKVGRRLGDVREAVRAVGRAEQGVYVERASCATERVLRLEDTADVDAPYFSLVLLPGDGIDVRRRDTR
ncbi:MAG: precorrin-2 C20-methyltransferase [Ilumatobacteraceae bacterium]|nr:precorrin-2 C20-methyltransferase [Ilumatobacteraceae bacterium]